MKKSTPPDRYHQRRCPKCGHWNGNSAITCHAKGCGAQVFSAFYDPPHDREVLARQFALVALQKAGDIDGAVELLREALDLCLAEQKKRQRLGKTDRRR